MGATPLTQKAKQEPIRPTLFLGLGGTGKEVLLRVRRRFWERFREKGLPCTRYLWIDTDTRALNAQGLELDKALAAVGLADEQFALLHGNVGKSAADIFTNKENWKFIHNWLYEEVERYGLKIADGAGGVRAIGRLTFFEKYTKLRQRITQELKDLGTSETIHATQDFYLRHELGSATIDDPTPVVILVCSLAGGTGCGTFLDTLFLLNNLKTKEDINIHQVFAYLFLPNVYYETRKSDERAERSYGNAYAALKELDFYSKGLATRDQTAEGHLSNKYLVEWEDRKRLQVPGPPCDAVYLLEIENEGGISVKHLNRQDVFLTLAESLFLDLLPGAFAEKKRSDYSNVTDTISGVADVVSRPEGVELPQSFSRRYATCGLSKIEIPVDAVRGACEAKLAWDIFLLHVLRDREDPNVKREVRNDLATYGLDRDGIPPRFGGAWKEIIRRDVRAVFSNINIYEEGQIHELEAKLGGLEDRLLRSDTTDKTKMGDIIKHLQSKTPTIFEESRQTIAKLLRESCLENEARGLRATLKDGGYLHQAITSTRALHAPPEAGVTAEFDVMREQSEKDFEHEKTQKGHHLRELRAALRSLIVGALGAKDWSMRKVLERLQEAVEQYLLIKAEMCLYEESKKVARMLVEDFAERQKDLDLFQQKAIDLASKLKDRYEAFLAFKEHVLITVLFDKDKDWPQFYKLGKDATTGQLQPVEPSREYKKMLDQMIKADARLLELADLLKGQGSEEVEKRVLSYCYERFRVDFRENPRPVNVLEHPLMKSRRQELIQRLVSSARPMLRQSGRMGAAEVKASRIAYLGISTPDNEPFRSVVAEISQIVRNFQDCKYDLQAYATQNPWEIYLYFSNYAYALPALPIVTNECHDAYNDFYDNLTEVPQGEASSQTPLHLSKHWEGKFDDLVVYNSAEAKVLIEVYKLFVFGPILKVLTLRYEKGQLVYQYWRGRPYSNIVRIGARRRALAKLCRDEDVRQMFSQAVRERDASLKPELLVSYWWALQALLNNGEFLPGMPEHTLLEGNLKEIEDRVFKAGMGSAIPDLKSIDPANRLSYIRDREGLGLEWPTENYPVLKNIEVWEKPAAGATA
jgi:hypothetical protein